MPSAASTQRTCFLHAGTHKTASTYLQSRFLANRKRLARHGITYAFPDKPARKFKSLATAAKEGNWAEWDAYLKRHAQSPGNLLLSAEQFTAPLCDQRLLRGLLATLERHDYRPAIIIYVRPQLDYINSMYVHTLRRLYHAFDFESYLKYYPRHYSGEGNKANLQDRYNFNQVFQPLLSEPGLTSIFVPFSRSLGDPFSQFLEALELPQQEDWLPGDPASGNVQPGIKAVWLARQLGLRLESLGIDGKSLRKTGQVLRNLAEQQGWDQDRYFGFSESLASSVLDHYAGDNDEFARRVWGKDWNSVFSGSTVPAQAVYEPASEQEREQMMAIVDSLLQTLASRDQALAAAIASSRP